MPAVPPVDATFFETAPQRYSRTFEIPKPAEEVWAELTGSQPMHWCTGLKVRWTSPAPHDAESTRDISIFGVAQGVEQFFAYEEGTHFSFYFSSFSLPVFAGFAEDYLLEPSGAGECRFTWRLGAKPSTLGIPGAPLNSLLVKSLYRDTARYFSAR